LTETILGAGEPKRYLLIFQNDAEIRPTGGFMGSFAEVKVRNGVIEKLDIPGGGTYDLQGQLRAQLVAPAPLQLLKARWEFQDANWFADFPTSARQMIQFFRDAGGPNVDGVIAVNARYVAGLLELLGPVDMPEYGRTIDAENFLFEAQKIVELEYDRNDNRPKAFIGDLAPLLIKRALAQDTDGFLDLTDELFSGLSQREIQMYFTDNVVEQNILDRGWGGEVRQTSGDYLMVVNTNLGGGKTDSVIEEHLNLNVKMKKDGMAEHTLTITRSHNGIKNELFTGVNNVNYVRVFVPRGARLIDASGFAPPDEILFETPQDDWSIDDDLYYIASSQKTHAQSGTMITTEHGKTVFGNWIQTAPGQQSITTLQYELPWRPDKNESQDFSQTIRDLVGLKQTNIYTLTLQKQSGMTRRTTRVNIETPDTEKTAWSSHESTADFDNTTDHFLAMILESL
jgi:hypothetical protein